MAPVIVLDYVTQPADFPTMKSHGIGGAIVYVVPAAWRNPKAVKPLQVYAAAVAGFPLAFNFEQGTQDYLGGYAKGQVHGNAIEVAMRELNLPIGQPCYLSIDTSVGGAEFGRAADYFRGAKSTTHHPLDFYGENALGEYLVSQGLVTRLWMSESTSFPGNGAPTPHVAVQQHYGWTVPGLGGSYDVDTVLQADWGQLPRPAGAPAGLPPAPPSKPDVPQKTGVRIVESNDGFITLTPRGFGMHSGTFDAGAPVKSCSATVHGPDPHDVDPASHDDWWPHIQGTTVTVQARGNHVVVTACAPHWSPGKPPVQVHVHAGI